MTYGSERRAENITAAIGNLRTEIIRSVTDQVSRQIALDHLARVSQVAIDAVHTDQKAANAARVR